jgi:hypothetical protein
VSHKTSSSPRELFAFIGGAAYGPPASVSTVRMSERHVALQHARPTAQLTTVWHPDVRRFYFAAPKPELRWYQSYQPPTGVGAAVHVAVHVRRGDVRAPNSERYLPSALVAQCIRGTLAALQRIMRRPASAMVVHVFSEGESEAFDELHAVHSHVELHLDEPLIDTFHHLVMADALGMAASTLSDMAAWLNVGRGGRIFAHPKANGLLKYVLRDLNVTRCDL